MFIHAVSRAQVAVKVIPINKRSEFRVIHNEIQVLRSSWHPNIVTYYDSYLTDTSLSVRLVGIKVGF